jgi:hypothetical protein
MRVVAVVIAGVAAVMGTGVGFANADQAGLSVANVSLVEGGGAVTQHIDPGWATTGTNDAIQVSVLNPPAGLASAVRASGDDASCQAQGYYTWVCAPYRQWRHGIDVVYQPVAADDTAPKGTSFTVSAVDLTSGVWATGGVTISAQADLQVSGPSAPGTGTTALTALVTNAGPSIATSVTLVIDGLGTITTPTLPDGCARSGATVTCSYSSIASGGFEQPVIEFGHGVGTITPTLRVTAATSDPNPANNMSSAGSWMIDLPVVTPAASVSPSPKPPTATPTPVVSTSTAVHVSATPTTIAKAGPGAATDGLQTMAMNSSGLPVALLMLIVALVLAGGAVAYLLRQQVVHAGPGPAAPTHAVPPYAGPSHAAPNHAAPTHARPGHTGRPVLERDRPRSDELL